MWQEEGSCCLCELDDHPPTMILSNASRKTDRQNETLERRKTNRQTETFERKPVAIPSETDRQTETLDAETRFPAMEGKTDTLD